jgi:hypothetical protein
MFRFLLLCITLLISTFGNAQFKEEKIKLPNALREISGLEILNDSILIAINDGGHEPRVFFITVEGKIIHSVFIKNAVNNDWEDLTMDDKGILYIADIGNNLNSRKDLKILKVNVAESFEKDTVVAQEISFKYEDQTAFPPNEDQLNFDCEAIFYESDSLFMIAKNRSKPWKAAAAIYGIPASSGNYTAKKTDTVFIGDRGWMKDAVTSGDNSTTLVYLLTYSDLLACTRTNGKLVRKEEYTFKVFTQKEAIAVASDNLIYVAAEGHRILGGPYLYTITRK